MVIVSIPVRGNRAETLMTLPRIAINLVSIPVRGNRAETEVWKTGRMAASFEFPSPLGEIGLKRLPKLQPRKSSSQEFPSPLGEIGLKHVYILPWDARCWFPSPLGEIGLKQKPIRSENEDLKPHVSIPVRGNRAET